jgi:hypothetical protein
LASAGQRSATFLGRVPEGIVETILGNPLDVIDPVR